MADRTVLVPPVVPPGPSRPPEIAEPAAAPDVASRRDARVAQLVEDHFDFVWRLLRRLGFDASAADDAAQDVFLVALHRFESIAKGHERTFLYGTALRVASNARRRVRRQREAPPDLLEDRRSLTAAPDVQTARARACAILDEILGQLPPELARVLVLAEIEELDGAEIAALEGVPVGTVASRLRRARAQLRKKLARFAGDLRPGEDMP